MKVETITAPWIILTNFFQKILLQRSLIKNFVVRDLKGRYVGSFMGFFWSILHPLVLLLSYSFVFSVVFNVRPRPDTGTDSFAVYLFCGMLPWLFFQDTVLRSCTVVVDNARIITKTIFPTEILPVTILLSNLVNHGIGFAILFALLLLVGKLSWFILLIPVYLLALLLFSLGLAWILASLNVFIRDTVQIISVALTFWFWFTPIFYSENQVPASFTPIVKANPLAYIIIGYRDCLLKQKFPDLSLLVILFVMASATFIVGGLFFRKTKREFVDVL